MTKKITIFSSKAHDVDSFTQENLNYNYELEFLSCSLDAKSAEMVSENSVVCSFVNDCLDASTLEKLSSRGVKLINLRCAGFNNVDLNAAAKLGIQISRVPAYSPNAVAEHAFALILTLNRKTHKAYNRTHESNFTIQGLMGFDLNGKTLGLIGTGKIGSIVAQIANGFGCTVLAYDPYTEEQLGIIQYVEMAELLAQSDIISLHCPLNTETQHLINSETIAQMKTGVMIINTSRGAVLDTQAVIDALKQNKIGYLGLDVYEEEEHVFHEDLSGQVLQDDVLSRLLSFPNVLITAHQGFFTQEAVDAIAKTSFINIDAFFSGRDIPANNLVHL